MEASGLDEREAPATIRIAEFTNRAKVKRDSASSKMEYLRQKLMAEIEG